MFPALIGVVIWRKLGGRIPLIAGVVGLLAVLAIIPAVRQLRDVGPYSSMSTTDVVDSFKGVQLGDAFEELGAMQGVLANVLKWVPAEAPFRYGRSYLEALKLAIPNVGLSNARSEREMMDDGKVENQKREWRLSPADWYIFRVNPWMFETGGGGGFSFIAEAYLNLGVTGIALVLFGLGYFLAFIDYRDLRQQRYWLIVATIAIWPLLKTIRNDFENFTKPIGLTLATLLIWWVFSKLIGYPRFSRAGHGP